MLILPLESVACKRLEEPHLADGPSRMLKQARLLTRPTLATTSPARPESAKTASLPRDAPCPKQGRSEGGSDTYGFRYVGASSRSENDAGNLFQHPASPYDT